MRPLDVGIIGGGTAGSAAALFLSRAGHTVTVYERVAEPRAIGAGITIQPSGLHVLARLGLYDEVVDRGAPIHSLRCVTRKDRPIVELSYADVDPRLFGLGLHRGVLFEALFSAATRAPITIRRGVEIVDLARAERPDRSRGQRWSWMVDVNRDRHGPHELVIVADGARSQLRDDTDLRKAATPYPWGALWFVGKSEGRGDTLRQVVDCNHCFLGMLPTGTGPGPTSNPPLVSLFWSIRKDRVDAWRARGLPAWKKDVLAVAHDGGMKDCDAVLDQIEDIQQVLFAAYHDVVMDRWSTRHVVYLGDAAHATSPQLGQGCNLALWDAMVLADSLAAEERDLGAALDTYSRERKDHLAFYQFATRWLTPFFQGDASWLGHLRDFGMPIAAKVPFFNRLMALSMLGIVDGFGGRTLTIDRDAVRRR